MTRVGCVFTRYLDELDKRHPDSTKSEAFDPMAFAHDVDAPDSLTTAWIRLRGTDSDVYPAINVSVIHWTAGSLARPRARIT